MRTEELDEAPRVVVDAGDTVGESALWDDRVGRLLWVDIVPGRIHAYDPSTGDHDVVATPDLATSIGLRAAGGYVVGLRREVATWDGAEGWRRLAVPEPDIPGNRLNEGVVGPDGAFWVGTMRDNIGPDGEPLDITESTGALYRVTADGAVHATGAAAIGITNTMVWTGGRFVTADTLRDAIYSYRVGPDGLSDRRTVLDGFPRGLPDGSCVDAKGTIWNARVAGGACLLRLTPDGAVLGAVDLPCASPTSCAFGGPGLATLYVTTARFALAPDHLSANPQEGALLALRPGVAGRPAHRFG